VTGCSSTLSSFAQRPASSGAIFPTESENGRASTTGLRNWAQKDVWAQIFRELRIDIDETASIADGSVVRAHQDASGGKGGSNKMLWDALVEVFQPRSTRSSTRKAGRSTSR
jgi:hypothetical protein